MRQPIVLTLCVALVGLSACSQTGEDQVEEALADINVIDHENLKVAPPVAHHDLPAGGTRLIQPVQGYVATLCNGVRTRADDEDTGARPGRLVRS